MDELCSTEEDKSEYTITEQKDAGDEVTYDVPNVNVSNVVYMATSDYTYFTEMLDYLNEYHDRQGQKLSSKNLKEAVLRIMEEEEEEIERNINNITCGTSFQSPVCMNVQKKDENW